MNTLDLMRQRRSIRKYQDKQVPRELLEIVLEAGSCAPNAGGGQRTILCGIQDRALLGELGKWNAACMDRGRLTGSYVSAEQPSLIDDPGIQSGLSGAPTVCVVFAANNFLYSVPDAFCCAENMVLAAAELGLASCVVARAEETFDTPLGQRLIKEWEIPENYTARCFVLLGWCQGPYPKPKPRRAGRIKIID